MKGFEVKKKKKREDGGKELKEVSKKENKGS